VLPFFMIICREFVGRYSVRRSVDSFVRSSIGRCRFGRSIRRFGRCRSVVVGSIDSFVRRSVDVGSVVRCS
jgi:hypothetical protein